MDNMGTPVIWTRDARLGALSAVDMDNGGGRTGAQGFLAEVVDGDGVIVFGLGMMYDMCEIIW
jgi:hypothetical protein